MHEIIITLLPARERGKQFGAEVFGVACVLACVSVCCDEHTRNISQHLRRTHMHTHRAHNMYAAVCCRCRRRQTSALARARVIYVDILFWVGSVLNWKKCVRACSVHGNKRGIVVAAARRAPSRLSLREPFRPGPRVCVRVYSRTCACVCGGVLRADICAHVAL